ncbi:hypothetical protein H4582DRAFT_1947175 [Lactarius indigo]|nr:hypothetical protein H4582DRAFT_1947175 [Lactarius indigo]
MVASLTTLTRLESLEIGFQYTLSRPSPGHLHPFTRVVLPALTKFIFLGVSEYLKDFLAQIDTPRLKNLEIRYFKQLGFQVTQLSWFLRRQELLQPTRLNNAHLKFSRGDIRIRLTSSQQPLLPCFSQKGPGLSLSILSEGLDRQISHLTQVLTQCFVILPSVDHLFISRLSSRLDQQDGLGDTEWLELFSLFTDVKSLLLSEVVARHIAHAFDGSASGMVAEALPALHQLQIWPRYRSAAFVEQFISLRRLSSQPITIVNRKRESDIK